MFLNFKNVHCKHKNIKEPGGVYPKSVHQPVQVVFCQFSIYQGCAWNESLGVAFPAIYIREYWAVAIRRWAESHQKQRFKAD